MSQKTQHWGIRKLTVGVASVLLSTTFWMGMNASVHADTVTPSTENPAITTTPTNMASVGSDTVSNDPLMTSSQATTMPAATSAATSDSTSSALLAVSSTASTTASQVLSTNTAAFPFMTLAATDSTNGTADNHPDETHVIKRTINIKQPDGTTTSQTQSVAYTGKWNADTQDYDWSLPAGTTGFAAVNLPSKTGYDLYNSDTNFPVTGNVIPALKTTVGLQNMVVNVEYRARTETAHVVIVDDDDNGVSVGGDGDKTYTGNFGTTADVDVVLPDGYALASGEMIPKTLTFDQDGTIKTITLHAHHIKVTVNHDAKDFPTAGVTIIPGTTNVTYPTGVQQDDLNRTITRKATINVPGQVAKVLTESVTFTRDATVDAATGKITYSPWQVNGQNSANQTLNPIAVPDVPGYTPEANYVAGGSGTATIANGQIIAWNVTPDTVSAEISVSYQAQAQSAQIIIVDSNGDEIAEDDDTLASGYTGQNVKLDVNTILSNQGLTGLYEVDANQPTSYTFTSDADQQVLLHVHERTVSVSHTQPQPNDTSVPGTDGGATFEGVTNDDLNQTITRTINVTTPDGKNKATKQVAKLFRDAKFNVATGEVTYTDWSSDNTSWTDFKPDAIAGYTVSQADVPAVTVVDGQQDQTISITYTANPQTTHIIYVDKNGNKVKTYTVDGKTGQTVDTNSTIPTGWKLVDGQAPAPKSITFTGMPTPDTTVKIEHATTKVSHDNPVEPGTKTPTGKDINGAHDTDLNQTITRTINVTTPDGKTKVVKQVAKIFRDASYDDVTGEVVYGSWSSDNASWTDFKPDVIAGYTASQVDVPAVTVVDGQQDQTISITYTANPQTTHIIYVDKNGNKVKTDTVNGKTGQTITTNSTIPTGWKLVDGQTPAPKSITFTGTPTSDATIKIEHATTKVTHDNPVESGTKTPTGKDINGAHDTDLNQNITRTINVTTPDGKTKVVKQVAKIFRDASYDDVTGEVAYGSWSSDNTSWSDFKPDAIAGYTVSHADVPAVTVVDGQKSQTVDITYIANAQTAHIIYVDKNGNTVKTYTVDGKTGQTISTNSTIPTGWKLVDGQTPAPKSITFTGTPTPDATIKIEHAMTKVTHDNPVESGTKTPTGKDVNGAHDTDLNQTITRTINVTTPDGKTKSTKQVAKIFRDASYDDVTGEVAYGSWSSDNTSWADFKPDVIAGYTASQVDVSAVTVVDGQKSQTVDITYTANEQSIKVNYYSEDGTLVTSQRLDGKTDQTVNVPNDLPDGWILYTGQVIPTSYTFHAHNDNIDLVARHLLVMVPSTHGETTKDLIAGTKTKYYPAGVTNKDLNKTVTRIITVVKPDGKTTTKTQSVHFLRNAFVDAVTGTVYYGAWSENGSYVFVNYTPQWIDGYTTPSAKAITVTPNSQNITETLKYVPLAKTLTVNYLNEQGQRIKQVNVQADKDGNVDLSQNVPAGYRLATTSSTVKLCDLRNTHYDVLVVPDVKTYTAVSKDLPSTIKASDLVKTVTRTIKIQLANGKYRTVKQMVHFTRRATVANGQTTFSDWTPQGFDNFNKLFIPKRHGYQMKITGGSVDKITGVTADMQDVVIVVDYVKA